MGKRVRFDDDARRALWRGIDQLASAVRITLGPRGRSVVLDRVHGTMPAITRDGIAIAQEMELPDPFENMGVQMLREVALRTGQAAGDGTSTATVLAHRIVGDGFAAVSAGGNPVALRRGIDAAVAAALAELAAQARPVEGEQDIARVASLAAGRRPRTRGIDRAGHHRRRPPRCHHRGRGARHGRDARGGGWRAAGHGLRFALLRDRRRGHGGHARAPAGAGGGRRAHASGRDRARAGALGRTATSAAVRV